MMRRGTHIKEADLKDVAKHIQRNIRDWELAKRMMEKVKTYWKTKNERDDLTLEESRAIYRDEDYGDMLPMSKKRNLDIDWTDHAEYRSDLRDIDPDKVNDGILEWLRDRLMTKGPDRKKVRMKLPGGGTAVVDYDLTQKPADADVITVWGSDMTAKEPQEVLDDLKMEFPFHSVQEKADRLYDKYGSGKFKGDEPVPEDLIRNLKPLERIWIAYFRVVKAALRQDKRLRQVYKDALEAADTFRRIEKNEDWRSEFVNLLARIKRTHTGLYAVRTAKKASLDLEWASPAEINSIAKLLGSSKLSQHDAAYITYCMSGLGNRADMASQLQRNAMSTYKSALEGWFEYALVKRANIVHFKGLNKALSKFVQDIPEAVLEDREPDIPPFREGWGFLDDKKLEAAGKRVVQAVREDAIEDGLWKSEENEVKPPLYENREENIWYVPYSRWTYENRTLLKQLGFRLGNKIWYTPSLDSRIERVFDVGGRNQNPSRVITSEPTLGELETWYFKEWLPKNINRFKNLFENYIRKEGSTITFDFNVNRNGKVDVGMTRGVTKPSQAIEELRLRYLGRQGRESWLEVMSQFIKLKSASGDQALHIIDRMNNLEHSNGMFMEKFPPSVQSWYRKFLNAKYQAPRVSNLAKYIRDRDIREFIIYLSDDPLRVPDVTDYREIEKDGPQEEGVDWLAKGYPYAPGQKRPDRNDPDVQKGLKELREFESSTKTATNLGPATFSGLMKRMSSGVRISSDRYERISDRVVESFRHKNRMPTDRNLGTRVHRDKKKFHKTKRQKNKQELRQQY